MRIVTSIGIVLAMLLAILIACATERGAGNRVMELTNRNTELITELEGIGVSLRDSNDRATERVKQARDTVNAVRDDTQRAIILFGDYTYIVSDLLRENKQLQREIEDLLAKHADSGGGTGSADSGKSSSIHTTGEGN